ncbi:hypothetical protein HWV07_05685 [Natronomonas salina]|uniref:hypothetical protein n=1 Tax=Natronomonas salina TaxID=1710540 RepID=UPI0015B3D1B6|nr:hypothetical protein [Natronomonas salina]QLD88550.1 hypothetical protein HWV07_05685 [Natronomonas salina]
MVDQDRERERQISRDRETIRNWADRHDVVPVREAGSGGEDRYRMVPERSVEDTHDRVEWNRFFDDFEDGDRVVVYHGEESDDPFEVSGHGDIATELDDDDLEERLLDGETVRSTVTETAVVESVVTEELTVESELIDRQTEDQRVVDSELLSRETTGCRLVDEGTAGSDEFSGSSEASGSDEAFDTDRYLDAVGGTTASAPGDDATTFEGRALPYDAELDVEERWKVTRELTERFVVESEIIGAEVTEADTLEDYDLDVQGLHRTIAESGIIEADLSTEEFLTEHDLESELTEDDRVTTSFTRERTVEDEVLDRMEVRGDLTGGEVRDMELVRSDDTVAGDHGRGAGTTGMADAGGSTGTTDVTGTDDATGTTGAAGTGTGAGAGSTVGGATLTDDEVGKTVVDPTGDEIGTVTGVDEDANAMYVDANPGLTERIKSALGWGGADDDDHRLDAAHVDRVDDDEIRLDHRENIADEDDERDRR